jgi:hypothetical protein
VGANGCSLEISGHESETFPLCVQFHRARTERDHRSSQRKIARFELLEITQHFVSVSCVLKTDVARNSKCGLRLRNADWRLAQSSSAKSRTVVASKDPTLTLDVPRRRGVVDGNADWMGERSQVAICFLRVVPKVKSL